MKIISFDWPSFLICVKNLLILKLKRGWLRDYNHKEWVGVLLWQAENVNCWKRLSTALCLIWPTKEICKRTKPIFSKGFVSLHSRRFHRDHQGGYQGQMKPTLKTLKGWNKSSYSTTVLALRLTCTLYPVIKQMKWTQWDQWKQRTLTSKLNGGGFTGGSLQIMQFAHIPLLNSTSEHCAC